MDVKPFFGVSILDTQPSVVKGALPLDAPCLAQELLINFLRIFKSSLVH